MKALLNIDYTNDFVAIDGALTCGLAGQAVHDYIVELTQKFADAGDYVAFMVDGHEENDPYHPETELFPPHNLKETTGRKFYGNLEKVYQAIKTYPNVEYFDKTRYSAFVGTHLELKLRERHIEELHLVGVCTDICILHTAIDAYNKGFKVVVHKKGVASFNPKGHAWALAHFKEVLGFDVK